MEAAQKERQMGELTQRALGGDATAMTELATVNFDRWRTLSTDQKAAAKQEAEVYGNAAMDVLSLPPQQRAQRIMGYAQQLGSQEIAQIAQLPPDQQEQALRAAIAEAGMVQKLIEMERPSYMAIPEGGTLVNTRDPGAVAQFGGQLPMGQSTAPTGTSSNNVMNFEAYQGMLAGLGPERAARQVQRLIEGGVVFAVNSPAQARQLPSGTPILLPDGTQGRVP